MTSWDDIGEATLTSERRDCRNARIVVDAERKPLVPCHPAVARKLLKQGCAAVLRQYPFTIILKETRATQLQDIRLKIDPGSRVTGIAILHKDKVIWVAELKHRGEQIRAKLLKRRQLRRSRRYRKARYRKAHSPSH